MSADDDFFDWSELGPVDHVKFDATIMAVHDRLDLIVVLSKLYGCVVLSAGARWRTPCFLPSLVGTFAGSCAEQDASTARGVTPRNLWVSEGDETRVWRCHSCGRRGDVIDLIEHAEELPRNPGQMLSLRAVRRAAKLSGVAYLLDECKPRDDDEPSDLVDVSAPRLVPSTKQHIVHFDAARKLNSRAAKHWSQLLRNGPGRRAREELARRGVTDEQVKRYRLGFAADEWRDLVGRLSKLPVADSVALGLLGKTRHGNLYDRQRDRIVFPYCDPPTDGRPAAITGFACRSMPEKQAPEDASPLTDEEAADAAKKRGPKWLNSVNMPGVWEKKSAMLGLYQAQASMERLSCERVAVGEGGWEMLAFDRVSAPSVGLVSAALTADHVDVIASVLGAKQVTVAFDGDEAGRDGTITAFAKLLTGGYAYDDVSALDCPDGSDPAELEAEELARTWASPLSIVAFAQQRPTAGKPGPRLSLLAALPDVHAATLRALWGLPASAGVRQKAKALDQSLPPQKFASLLLSRPGLSERFAWADVDAALGKDALSRGHVKALSYADTTRADELTPSQLRAWLNCQLHTVALAVTLYNSQDWPTGSSDEMRRWYKQGEDMRARMFALKEQLAET